MQGNKQNFLIILEVPVQKFKNHYSRGKSYTCAQEICKVLMVALCVTAQVGKI